jgi:hypothetical protein
VGEELGDPDDAVERRPKLAVQISGQTRLPTVHLELTIFILTCLVTD